MKYVVKKMGLERFRRHGRGRGGARRRPSAATSCAPRCASWSRGTRVPPAAAGAPQRAAVRAPGFDALAAHERPRRSGRTGYRDASSCSCRSGDITQRPDARRRPARRDATATGRCAPPTTRTSSLPWIAEAALPAVHAALVDIGLGNADAGTIADVVSCPGMDYCSLAITRSMGVAERIRAHLLDDPATRQRLRGAARAASRVKISGCPNSCGQHHIGDIGLTGHSVTDERRRASGRTTPSWSAARSARDAGRVGQAARSLRRGGGAGGDRRRWRASTRRERQPR